MGSSQTLKIFSREDIRAALPMREAVAAMKDAFLAVSAKSAAIPPRTHVRIPEYQGDALFMPSYSPDLGRMGLKIVTLCAGNREKGLPLIQELVVLLDAATGAPLAVMEGAVLTAIRTGAASGAATDALARPDAATVAVFGAGVQAATQLEAVCTARDVRKAAVFDVDGGLAAEFAATMQQRLGIVVESSASSADALAAADIVCTATTSQIPVFADEELAPGTHINAIGSYKPHVREIPPATVARARVVVDQIEAAWQEAGDLIMARDEGLIDERHVHSELGQILRGEKPGRETPEQVTFFKSVGLAVQDLAAACAVLKNGNRLGLGTTVSL